MVLVLSVNGLLLKKHIHIAYILYAQKYPNLVVFQDLTGKILLITNIYMNSTNYTIYNYLSINLSMYISIN